MEYITALKRPIVYWQYKHSPRFLSLMNGIVLKVMKYYPCEIWEMLDLDTATGYALDLIGQRLGYPRPVELPEAIGVYDLSRYAQAYYDGNVDETTLVKDDTYRYMLKMRVTLWQPWHGITISSFYAALSYAFPDVDFWLYHVPNTKIMRLYIMSFITYPQRRALFSDVIKAPMGQTLLVYDAYEDPSVLPDDESESESTIQESL